MQLAIAGRAVRLTGSEARECGMRSKWRQAGCRKQSEEADGQPVEGKVHDLNVSHASGAPTP